MKLKKILACGASLLIAASMIAVPAISANAVQDAVIDTTKTGTVTIHKYEMEDISGLSATTNKGTGVATDASKVPSNAYPLNGVTFTLKLIKPISSNDVFSYNGAALPSVATARTMAASQTFTGVTSGTGANAGTATFSNLPLGIYLVQEKTDAAGAPGHVKQPVEDFVISVPMTKPDGTGWNYTLNLYPKNKVNYTNIALEKIDHSNSAKKLQGATFKLERYVYTHTSATAGSWGYQDQTIGGQATVTTNASGAATLSHIPCGYKYKLTETAAPTDSAGDYILDRNNNSFEFTIDVDGEFTTSSSGNFTVSGTGTSKKITIENSRPSIKKYVGTNVAAKKTETTIGHTSATDHNKYSFVVKTPNVALGSLSTFQITDTVRGASTTPTVTSVKRASDGVEMPQTSVGWTATSNTSGANTYILTVNFSTASGTTFTKDTEYIVEFETHTTVLDSNTTNQAELTYSVDTSSTDTSVVTSNQTTVRPGGYAFKKIGESNQGLSGFEYKLYPTLSDAQNGTNAVSAYCDTLSTPGYTNTFVSDSNGMVVIKYIDYGSSIEGSRDYWIVETKAKGDYNLLKDPVKITVNKNSYAYANTSMNVKNVLKTQLPLTGGLGIILFAVIGLAIAGAGTAYIIKVRRKTNIG